MTETNKALFEKLKIHVPKDYQQIQRDLNRWINTDPVEKNWLKNAKFEKDEQFDFDKINRIALAFLDSELYLICSGLKPTLPEDDFEYCQLNAGLFCAAVIDLNIDPIIRDSTGLDLVENIFTPITDYVTIGIEYKLESIEKYFPKISIYKIHPKSPFFRLKPTLPRVGLFVATKCPELHHLDWTQLGLETARIASTLEVEVFPYELILRAITERKWEHAFLEIYRAIEFLYPFPKINELKIKLKLDLSSQKISEFIEDTLGWRPTEEGALQGLLKDMPEDMQRGFNASFTQKADNMLFDNIKIASRIYRLRNDCVHFRPIQRASNLVPTVDWQLLLQTMLITAHFCYSQQITGST